MDDVVVLSDSSSESEDTVKVNNKKLNHDNLKTKNLSVNDSIDYEFPKVNFNINSEINNSDTDKKKEKDFSISDFPDVIFDFENDLRSSDIKKQKEQNIPSCSKVNEIPSNSKNAVEKEWSDSDFPELNNGGENDLRNKKIEQDSQNDSDYETQNEPVDKWDQYIEQLHSKYKAQSVDLSSDENEELIDNKVKGTKGKCKRNASKPKKAVDEDKQRRKEEREQKKIQKQEEAARQKALRQLNLKNRLQINPEHSMKLMEIIFDNEIEKFEFFFDITKGVEVNEVKYNVRSQLVPKSIVWKRKKEENYVNDKNEICSNVQTIDENLMIIIWDCEETVNHLSSDTFMSTICNIKSMVPNKRISLVIYKIEDYFKYLKTVKGRAMQEEILGGSGNEQKKAKTKTDKQYSNFPKVSRNKFEESLVEIQLLYNISSRLIENVDEMVLLIHQYTKSLALLPSKLEKRQDASKVDWYVSCDNRDTVKVDKDGNGLKRLWQQQLCQFTLMSLETSEAISSMYQSPLVLMEAYKNCTPTEGEALLKDIPIRRAAGPITSVRKIGSELSKKIFLTFTSEDGEIYLN